MFYFRVPRILISDVNPEQTVQEKYTFSMQNTSYFIQILNVT